MKKIAIAMLLLISSCSMYAMEFMQDEDEEGGDSFEAELFYNDAINLSRSFGIDWEVSDLSRLQQALEESIKKEADTIKLFF